MKLLCFVGSCECGLIPDHCPVLLDPTSGIGIGGLGRLGAPLFFAAAGVRCGVRLAWPPGLFGVRKAAYLAVACNCPIAS